MVRAAAVSGSVQQLQDALAGQLGRGREHVLLVNDEADSATVKQLARPATTVLVAGKNLGVAAGRQRLFDEALGRGAELVVSLDDDLIVPLDLLEALEQATHAVIAAGSRPGLVGPIVLAGHKVDTLLGVCIEALRQRTVAQLAADVAAVAPVPSDALYHAGIASWRQHYLRALGATAAAVQGPLASAEPAELRRRPSVRRGIGTAGPVEVDTLPGGVLAVTADAIRAAGGIDQRYGPFGYEDAGFAIAVRDAGFTNVVLPSVPVIHDVAARATARPSPMVGLTSGRAKGLLCLTHADSLDALDIVGAFVLSPLLGAVDREEATPQAGLEHLGAMAVGFAQASWRASPIGVVQVQQSVSDTAAVSWRLEGSLQHRGPGELALAVTGRLIGRRHLLRRRSIDVDVGLEVAGIPGYTTARWWLRGPVNVELTIGIDHGPLDVTTAEDEIRGCQTFATSVLNMEVAPGANIGGISLDPMHRAAVEEARRHLVEVFGGWKSA